MTTVTKTEYQKAIGEITKKLDGTVRDLSINIVQYAMMPSDTAWSDYRKPELDILCGVFGIITHKSPKNTIESLKIHLLQFPHGIKDISSIPVKDLKVKLYGDDKDKSDKKSDDDNSNESTPELLGEDMTKLYDIPKEDTFTLDWITRIQNNKGMSYNKKMTEINNIYKSRGIKRSKPDNFGGEPNSKRRKLDVCIIYYIIPSFTQFLHTFEFFLPTFTKLTLPICTIQLIIFDLDASYIKIIPLPYTHHILYAIIN